MILIAPVLEQVVNAAPATAVGSERIVSVFVLVTFAQPALDAVNVRVTLPDTISAALGVYVQVVNEFELANVPVPLEVHVTAVWFVAVEPAVILTAPTEEQVVIAVPAFAVIALLMVSTFVDVTLAHGALANAVNVKVTLPAVISAALGL